MDMNERPGWQTAAITIAAVVLSYIVLTVVNYFVVALVLQNVLLVE